MNIKNPEGRSIISFSQLSTYNQCNYKWYLQYIEKMGRKGGSIYLLFGTAMHSTIQHYLQIMYNDSASEADKIDLYDMLFREMKKEFDNQVIYKKDDNGNIETDENGNKVVELYPTTPDELYEFYNDGVEILKFFKKHRHEYFNKKGYELVGIEYTLEMPMERGTLFVGAIDILIKDIISDRLLIKDIKTSTNGWKDYKKKDKNTTNQILLYKKFYSEQFDIDIDKIEVEFIILKRKLYENVDYPQKRIQRFSPSEGTPSVVNATKSLDTFIKECFNDDGTHNTNRVYEKNPTKLCDWCEFGDVGLCDKKK